VKRGLAIVERAYRGALEVQFADALYCAALFHAQLGGLDLLLRGAAVTYALPAVPVPALTIGRRIVGTLNDPRAGLAALAGAGVHIWVEERDLRAHGVPADRPLMPGARTVAPGELATRWPDYSGVFFL
jgi:hypothetical protein